jgi:hypothetical protein
MMPEPRVRLGHLSCEGPRFGTAIYGVYSSDTAGLPFDSRDEGSASMVPTLARHSE